MVMFPMVSFMVMFIMVSFIDSCMSSSLRLPSSEEAGSSSAMVSLAMSVPFMVMFPMVSFMVMFIAVSFIIGSSPA